VSDSAPIPGNSASGPVPFAKGHGTENDFVIVPDPDGLLEITPQLVRALCDRRAGIGADGLLRVVRTSRIPEGLGLEGDWFMDYRNGDGSIAEMCGNGSRVFARYLVESGLARAGTMRIATRAGTKLVVVPDGESDVTIDMGPALIGVESVVQVGGRSFAGIAVSMGNPHLVCGTMLPVEELDLSSPPQFDPGTFPTGVNVEIVNVLAGDPRTTPGVPAPEGFDLHVRMRVYERGSGETRSCGTGSCAVAAVALRSAGKTTGRVAVDVPGGRVAVTVTTATTLLEGPAVLVAGGQLSPEWLAGILAGDPAVLPASETHATPARVLEAPAPADHPVPAHAAPARPSDSSAARDEAADGSPTPQPEAAQREAAQREAVQREAAQREAAQREAAQREAVQREAAQREAAQREAAQREAAQREAAQREAAQREAAQREAAQREAVQREAAQREAAQREAAQREAAQREAAQREAAQREMAEREAAQREVAEREAAQREAAQREAARSGGALTGEAAPSAQVPHGLGAQLAAAVRKEAVVTEFGPTVLARPLPTEPPDEPGATRAAAPHATAGQRA